MINVPYEDMPREIEALLGEIEQLEEENQQLKESYCNRTDCSGRLHDSRKYPSIKQQLDLYKSVLDEIKEQLKLERKLALSLNKPYTVSVIDKLLDKVKQ